jgi:predicted DNA-binding transcriptional regulator
MNLLPGSNQREHAITSLLRRLGLDDREITVYLALLSLRTARASAVAKAAKQSRSHTYLVLRSLQEKGLVAEVERGKVMHFTAESPERLLGYIEGQEEELKSLKPLVRGALPYLQSLQHPLLEQARITTLHGAEGMKQVYRDLLGTEFRGFLNPQTTEHAFGRESFKTLLGKRTELKGRDLLVDGPAAKRYVQDIRQHEGYEIRLFPTGIEFPGDTIVSGDTVAFLTYDREGTIIRLEHRSIAQAMRAWFDLLWQLGRPTESGFSEPIL